MNRKDLQNMEYALLHMVSFMQSIKTKRRLTKDDKEKLSEAWFDVTEYRDQERKRVRVLEKVEAVLELEKDWPQYEGGLVQIISDYSNYIEEELKKRGMPIIIHD